MKKTRFLALALVVAMALVGAGYALWSDTLYVESTVNTGHLDVDFIKVEKAKVFGIEIPDPKLVVVDYSIGEDTDFSYGDHEAFNKDNPMSNRDKVFLTLTNFYPGAEVSRVMTVKNTGTVPARIDITKLLPVNYDVLNTLAAGLNEAVEDDIEITVEPVDDNQKGEMGLNSATVYFPLGVGNEMSFRVNFKFNSKSGNETEHKTYKFLMELPFEQGDSIL